jgi:AraC-like DNA-binding protein
MRPVQQSDRIRLEWSLRLMYEKMDRQGSFLFDDLIPRYLHCSRRQIERAFEVFSTSPAAELRQIRAKAAAAQLVKPRSRRSKLAAVASRVGYAGTRALRSEMRWAWGMSPRDLRTAAALHHYLSNWEAIRAERLAEVAESRRKAAYHRVWREFRRQRKKLKELLLAAPVETRRLIRGELQLPTAQECAEHAAELARKRVLELESARRESLAKEAA